MFIGHIAVALAAKRITPKTSLGTLLLSVQWLDLVWPVMLLLGLEHVRIDPGNTAVTPLDFYDYPITHSLVGAAAWSLVLGSIYWFARRNRLAAVRPPKPAPMITTLGCIAAAMLTCNAC